MKTLDELRAEIDQIDDQLLQILAKRVGTVKQVGELKAIEGLPALDEKRYEELLKTVKEKAKNHGLSEDFVEKLYRTIHDYAVELEKRV